MGKITFTILGSSAGMPQSNRINSGYVLGVDDRLFQFDCGGGISHAFCRTGFDPLAVERIFISHTHPDHISDLPLFVQMRYLADTRGEKQRPLYIHVPGEALNVIKTYFRAVYLLSEELPFEIYFLPIPEDGSIESEDIAIIPFRNSHLDKYALSLKKYAPENQMQCYSFLIKSGGKTILYSSDLGSEADLFPYLDDLDLLVVESTHINITALLEKAAEYNIDRIILTHFTEGYDIGEAFNTAKKLGVSTLVMAFDGMKVEF